MPPIFAANLPHTPTGTGAPLSNLPSMSLRNHIKPGFGARIAHSLTYRPELDGLRAIAVLLVLLHHVFPNAVTGGYVGVDVFFVISGYLITQIISREIEVGTFNFFRFYARRVARLLPALFSVLVACTTFGWFYLVPSQFASTTKAALGAVLFGSNVVLWRELQRGYFAQDASENPLLHTWSLGVEEQFYFAFPLLLVLLLKWNRKRSWNSLLFCAAISFSLSQILLSERSVAVFFLSPFRAWELLAGCLLALALPPRLGKASYSIAAAIGMALVIGSGLLFEVSTPFPGLAALAPVLGTILLLSTTGKHEPIFTKMMSFKPIVYLGLISYSLYLWHWPLLVFIKLFFGPDLSAGCCLAIVLLSLALASLSYHWIEKPFRTQAVEIESKRVIALGLAAGLPLMLALGAAVASNGAPARFPVEVSKLDGDVAIPLPYEQCEKKACSLGAPDRSDYLFWGDSHMLSWAPAVAAILAKASRGGVMVYQNACAPVLPQAYEPGSRCSEIWDTVRAQLDAHPDIHTVVLSARWLRYMTLPNRYFRQPDMSSEQVAHLFSTAAQDIQKRRLRVVVIGPVPEYSRSVPVQVIQRIAFGWAQERITIAEQQARESVFSRQFSRPGINGVDYVDPAITICPSYCRASDGIDVYYRDSHHLNALGATIFADSVFAFILKDASRDKANASQQSRMN